MIAGDGDDVVYGGLAPFFPDSLNVPDTEGDLVQDNGDDVIYGGGGDDWLYGADDSDEISGGTGNDYIEGGIDNDTLTGDDGNDIFAFWDGDGIDTVTDFSSGEDLIQIGGGITFEDLMLSQDESTAVIEYNELIIRLENTEAEDLDATNFLF